MQVTVNGQPRQVADGATVAALLDELRLAGKPVAVEVNLELCPSAAPRPTPAGRGRPLGNRHLGGRRIITLLEWQLNCRSERARSHYDR